jgi:hypothetical protein
MATQADYNAGSTAAAAVLQSDLTQLVPSWAQGWIPPDEAQQLAPAVAKAVIDAVDAERTKQLQGN